MAAPVDRIQAAYAAGAQLLQAGGWPVEPPAVAVAVEGHRWAWRPADARVLLVAESHVFTSAADAALRVHGDLLPAAAQHAPAAFVRLVYCLGYGEPALLSGTPPLPNPGTRQFWDIFGLLAGTGLQPRGGRHVPWQDRVRWKVQTLQVLAGRGVWLLDASLHALYFPGGTSVSPALKRGLYETWWRHYGAWLIRERSPAAKVWAVSKGVAEALTSFGYPPRGWVYHPNAKITAAAKAARWDALLRDVAE